MDASSQYVWNIKFINEIEKRPGIWNQSIRSRDLQKRLWGELSKLYNNKTVDSLKRKYNNLKLKFHQQLNNIPQTNNEFDIDPRSFESDWPHYEQLFLLNEFEAKKNEKRKSTCQEKVPVAKKKRAANVTENVAETPSDPHVLNTFDEIKEEIPTEIIVRPDIVPVPPTDDGLYHFLMGLYCGMHELDTIRRIKVQARIYAMLSEEVSAAAAKK